MGANLYSKSELNAQKILNNKESDFGMHCDEEFRNIYDAVVKEADEIRKRPSDFEPREISNKNTKKKIVLVESIITDDDEKFIQNLYTKVLGREPDKTGYENLIKRIRSNEKSDKEKIIFDYWKTQEGQTRNIEVIGFKKVYMDELLSHNGEDFIEHAFYQILGRKSSERDIKNYSFAMEQDGKTKEEIIKIIKESEEAKKRNVSVEGFEKAFKKRKKMKDKILSIPVIGNLLLACWNLLHINKRLKDINNSISELNIRLEEEKDINRQVINLSNLDVTPDYLERLNYLLSSNMTVWGSRERLHISPKASVFTCLFNTNSGDITVGDYTFAGSGVSVLAGSHDKNLKGLLRRDVEENEGFDIEIGSGVWLGSNSTILGPSKIGDNAVIAAGSVVIPGTIVPENAIFGGIPAKQIGEPIIFENTEKEAVERALNRRDGILFTKGWSEKNLFVYEGVKTSGYHLLDTEGTVLLNPGKYYIKYAYTEDSSVKLAIDCGEKINVNLEEKEGSLDFEVKENGNAKEYIEVSFNTDTLRKDFALMIYKKINIKK